MHIIVAIAAVLIFAIMGYIIIKDNPEKIRIFE